MAELPRLHHLAFSPASPGLLAAAHEDGLDLWSWPGLTLVKQLRRKAATPRRVAFDVSGRRAVVTAWGGPLELLDPPLPLLEQLEDASDGEPPPLVLGLAFDDAGAVLAFDREHGLMRHLAPLPTPLAKRLCKPAPAWLWNAAILPRRRQLLLGRNDDDVLMVPWGAGADAGAPMGLRQWLAPHRLTGATAFCVSSNRAETVLAMGGKHSYLQLIHTTADFVPERVSEIHCGGRVVITALHPHDPICAAQTITGPILIHDTTSGAQLAELPMSYSAAYP